MEFWNKPHKIHVLESYSDGDFRIRVSDHFFDDSPEDNMRDISFKSKNMPYYYLNSAVFLDETRRRQPIYVILQDIIESWTRRSPLRRALVLGCAGCTIPRFLVLNYPSCHVVGVEISSQMIDLASRYFFIREMNERFSLVHEDAFKYVEQCADLGVYDFIFVDLFHGTEVLKRVFSLDYISELSVLMTDRSMLVVNLLDVAIEDASIFATLNKALFDCVALIRRYSRIYLTLAKSEPKAWIDFIRSFEGIHEVYAF